MLVGLDPGKDDQLPRSVKDLETAEEDLWFPTSRISVG